MWVKQNKLWNLELLNTGGGGQLQTSLKGLLSSCILRIEKTGQSINIKDATILNIDIKEAIWKRVEQLSLNKKWVKRFNLSHTWDRATKLIPCCHRTQTTGSQLPEEVLWYCMQRCKLQINVSSSYRFTSISKFREQMKTLAIFLVETLYQLLRWTKTSISWK